MLYLTAFLSWLLTVLAPCVLPILPVIFAWSSQKFSIRRTIVICLSFMVSIVIFTIFLKATTIAIWFSTSILTTFSGVLLILFWFYYIFPEFWDRLISKVWPSRGGELIQSSNKIGGVWWEILLWFSLGPLFSSCSPTYALIIAIVFPASWFQWLIAIMFHAIGVWLILFLLAVWWNYYLFYSKILANPNWIFKKIMWSVILFVGILVISGFDKVFESRLIDFLPIDSVLIERSLLNHYCAEQSCL
jgi:cytochrome c biogenesis protein CcdA